MEGEVAQFHGVLLARDVEDAEFRPGDIPIDREIGCAGADPG